MNSLHNETLTWIGDGSNGGTVTQADNSLTISSASSGTPFIVRATSESTTVFQKDYYFQATLSNLEKGHLSIGVVAENEFRPGWKTKGMFYNGNLTNGSAALKTSWGPRFQQGDSLGVRVSHEEGLQITFYKNGASLGTGFHLANNNTTFYPCFSVTGTTSLVIDTPAELPPVTMPTEEAPVGIYGDWKLEKAMDGETPLTVPSSKRLIKFVLSKEEKEGDLKLHFMVGNNIGGHAKIVQQTSEDHITIECDPFMSTRMLPPPELRSLEQLFTSKQLTTIQLKGEVLVLSGPEMSSEWSRLIREPETLQSY